ncbi:hypothetical protein OSB04_007072 [Centaurea solstitialis]|uniref:Uncharacterized protein n=1 Tax=Centaurea solstitialis TaxID=347529 RepID=A0AA38U2G4_9ASTR|nr:hypothetical protein OSB04_007072 [Centaurea solstitialis]
MEVGSPEKEVRGSFRSPREVNITATSEGLLQSKSTEATCVGASESPRDYVTNEDFQNFATSVLHKLDELKSSTSRSTEAAPDTKVQEVLSQHIETLKAHTEALTKVTSAIDSLQASISSLPSKVYVSDAINSVQVNSSFLDLLKTELAEIGKEYARDLAASRYINYNSFKTEIHEILDKAITIGVSPYQGHPKSLATRGDLSNMVAALGEEVRHTSAQFMYDNKLNMQIQRKTMDKLVEHTISLQANIIGLSQKVVDEALYDKLAPFRKLSKKHTVQLRKVKLACSTESNKPSESNQDDQP